MFGLISIKKYKKMVSNYEAKLAQVTKDCEQAVLHAGELRKEAQHKLTITNHTNKPKYRSGFNRYTTITPGNNMPSDDIKEREIWKPIPHTDWKVSNFCRFMDSKGNVSIQTNKGPRSQRTGLKSIVIPKNDGTGSLGFSDLVIMVHAFNPNSFPMDRYAHRQIRFINKNGGKHLSNITF